MGAGNVAAAYRRWAGKVPPLSMQVLAYMALVAKDSDPQPWFGQGHEALAEFALGRLSPIARADVKAVERAVSPLLAVGAIVVDRKAAPRSYGPKTVRYRLVLALSTAPPVEVDVPRNVGEERPPESVHNVPRNPSSRPPESVQSSPGIRGTEDYEEQEEQREEIDGSGPQPSTGRAHAYDRQNDDSTGWVVDERAAAYAARCEAARLRVVR